jgi:molecular chaperone HtpG
MSKEQMEFKTEVKQLLDLVIHSNASDAIDKGRHEALTNDAILEGKGEWKIKLISDKTAGTITISDNGIGLTRDEAAQELGTIAHSGTRGFLEALQKAQSKDIPELIGQFGVGFYSAFMVADRVTVISRKAGSGNTQGIRWESSADGTYTVEEKEKTSKGTDVVLHLKEDSKEFLEEFQIRSIIKKYSDYVEHPIVMDVEREKESEIEPKEKIKVTEEETLNSRKALWLKSKAEVSDEEHNEFYRHISHDFGDPLRTIHWKAEGQVEFASLLYLPKHQPMGIFMKDFDIGPALYVNRVQIMPHCPDLIPPYLRFVSGVVEASDLPLNVSREMLQNDRAVGVIKKNIIKKVLDTLREMKDNDYDNYVAFHKELGKVLKEGIHYDFSRKEEIASLLLVESTETKPGEYTTLEAYVDRMKPDQKDIYYMVGQNRADVENSPYLEGLKSKGFEVLFMLDEIDDLILGTLGQFKEKSFKSVVKGEVAVDEEDQKKADEAKDRYNKLIELMKAELGEKVKEVRLSSRLTDSACCLVVDEGGMDPGIERFMRAMGQDVPGTQPILELNPSHPVVEGMHKLFESDPQDARLKEYTGLLYGQALMLSGTPPEDPAGFAKKVADLMAKGLEGK